MRHFFTIAIHVLTVLFSLGPLSIAVAQSEKSSLIYKIESPNQKDWINADLKLTFTPDIEAKSHELEIENISAKTITVLWNESSFVVLKDTRSITAGPSPTTAIPPHSKIKATIRDRQSTFIGGREILHSLCVANDDSCLGKYMLFLRYEINGNKKDLKANFIVSR